MTEPSAGEKIIWQHSGDGVKPQKPLTDSQRARRVLAYRILWFMNVLYFAYSVSRADFITFLQSVLGLTTVLGMVLLFILFPRLDKAIASKFTPKRNIEAVPLWMSRDRIMFNPTYLSQPFEVRVRDIKSVSPDFAMGSPSIALGLQQKTVNLISSETHRLLEQLYILRPDLKPAI